MADNKKIEFFFDDPLIGMGVWNRLWVRTILNISMVIFVAGTIALISSTVQWLFWTGILCSLYLADRFVRRGEAQRSIHQLLPSGQVNAAQYATPRAMHYIISAHDKSLLAPGDFMLNLAFALSADRGVKEALVRLDVDPDEFKDKLSERIKASREVGKDNSSDTSSIFEKIENVVVMAIGQALLNGDNDIDPVDLFAAISLMDNREMNKLFDLFEIDPGDLEKAVIFGRFNRGGFLSRLPRSVGGFGSRRKRKRVVNRAWTSRPTPTFDLYSTDLTESARLGQVGFMIGHKDEYERMLNILSRSVKPNALLVGEPGAGMNKLVEHLAYRIIKDQVPRELFDKRLVALDLGRLLAGADQSELQARIQRVFGEIYSAGNIILAIPEIHNLAKTASNKEINAADTIIPLVTNNDFPLVGGTYPKEYKRYIESDSSFAQAFDVIRVGEITHDEAIKVLIYEGMVIESQYRVKITFGAIKKAVELASRYFREKPLPGSAIDLVKEALARASRNKDKKVSGEDIIAVAESRVNIPIRTAGQGEAEKLLNLEELIHERMVDQAGAVKLVAQSLREYRAGLSRKGGPIGSFLFVGPTGVGKTELSKILAKLQFGSEDAMIRFDMSEYQDKQSFFQFIGSPDGTMSGLLTDRVLEKPYSLILLDEFEKAHPDILNLFLQVFDDGRLTDNFGRVVSFENTIIIATSNAHSAFIKEEIEKNRPFDEISAELKKKLVTFFRPELLNRFSSVVTFRNLRPEDIAAITKIQMRSLTNSLKDAQGIYLEVSDEAMGKIAELGYDPVFGARPLRQVISEKIKDPLSKMILSGSVSRGTRVTVELSGDGLVLKVD